MEPKRSPSTVLRVFLSSTYVDLQAHRAAVRDIIGRLGQFTLAMEQFGAREGDAQTVSTELVADCGLYLGVIAWRYGYVPAGEQRSVTQLEYEAAGRMGIPRLVFLAAPETQTAGGPDDLFPASARDPEHMDQLLAFRAEIERAQVVDYFTTPDDLAKKGAAALHQYLQAHPAAQGPKAPRVLPPRAPGFVGREADLEMLAAGLRQGQAMAVVGMGGLGKSSVAAEAVHTLAAESSAFPGGVTWVRCDERTGLEGLTWLEDQLLAAWGASLSAEALRGATTPEQGLELRERALRERLRAPDGRDGAVPPPALVLYDNVERELPLSRLLDTVMPLGITPLLTMRSDPTSPHLRLVHLDGLPSPAAVQLFAERYTDRGGTWDTERDAAATTAIVEALGGLPLAIELAAARAARTQMALVAVAEELRAPDALARLSDPLDPSASVRYSLAKTLTVLSDIQRVRFAALGLPEGPDWPLPVIERMLAGVPAAQEGVLSSQVSLEALVAYSLVGLTAAQGAEAQRVRLHPLVRNFAREAWAHVPAADQEGAKRALLAGVQDWVTEHPVVGASTSQTLERDEELVVEALRVAVAHQVALPQVVSLVEAWDHYLSLRSYHLMVEMYTLQWESACTIGALPAALAALGALATASHRLGRPDDFLRYTKEALTIARELGDSNQIIRLLGRMGARAAEQGARTDAERMYDEANALALELGAQLTNASALNNLGILAQSLGHPEECERWLQRALERYRATEDLSGEITALYNLGEIFEVLGDLAAAQRYYEEGLTSARSVGNAYAIGAGLNALGQLALKTDDLETASRDLTEALPLSEQEDSRALGPYVRGNLALLTGLDAQRSGDREAAAQAFAEALRLFEEVPAGFTPGTDQRPFVRQLLAEVRERPSVSAAEAPTQVPAAAPEPAAALESVPRAKRRWWLWGR
jgi:tetratricopeptide (TPR) repeat protein